MGFLDILRLSLRNLREARLRAALTTLGVIVGVAMIVTMISFGLGLQRNTVARFKALDLFNEITVFGRSLTALATFSPADSGNANKPPENNGRGPGGPGSRTTTESKKNLDDAAIAEIQRINGVSAVEPSITFTTFVRSNERSRVENSAGVLVPNLASRFKEFSAGGMISSPAADEVVVTENFLRDFGYSKPEDAIGKTVELLAPPSKREEGQEENFFGIPLNNGERETGEPASPIVAKTLRITGVMKESGGARFRGFSLPANLFVPLETAKIWRAEHQDDLSDIALQLARESGALGASESYGYQSAVVRVSDPVALTNVRKRLTEMGFTSFSIMDELEQLRTVFLIMNSVLGLLGGISLLVASFGIANTMIMSILERTREIGIMKAIGAEDLEIKLIFFVEAAFIGFFGGLIGCVAAVVIDSIANRLAFRFVLKPQGADYVDFFALPPYLWLGAIAFAVVVAIAAALYPAARAARIDPVKALRHD
jgi:ABC-type antimicrobial peptide transport system permease subunit